MFATVADRMTPADLTPASGRQDHTTSPSAACAVRQRHCYVHRIPRPTSVTIAIRPSSGTGWSEYKSDLGQERTGIFLRKGLDRQIAKQPVGQISRPVRHVNVGSSTRLCAIRQSSTSRNRRRRYARARSRISMNSFWNLFWRDKRGCSLQRRIEGLVCRLAVRHRS